MIWLDNARIIATFAVILLHSAANTVTNSPIGTTEWWFGNVYDAIVRWCVPAFVMISGALLLEPRKQEDLKTFYDKRSSRLLIPIVFWSAFYLLWGALKAEIKGDELGILDLANSLLSGKPHFHMWFLYMIIPLYLFTPFLRKVILSSSRTEIYVLILFLFIFSAINSLAAALGMGESKLFINWFLSYISYYILGYFIKTSKANFSMPALLGVFAGSVFLTALGCYIVAQNESLSRGLYFYDYLSITVIPMSVSIFYILKRWYKPIGNEKITKTVLSLTLGVYLIHPVFLEIISYAGHGSAVFNPAISIPIMSVVIFVLSLSVAWIINKIPYINRVI